MRLIFSLLYVFIERTARSPLPRKSSSHSYTAWYQIHLIFYMGTRFSHLFAFKTLGMCSVEAAALCLSKFKYSQKLVV